MGVLIEIWQVRCERTGLFQVLFHVELSSKQNPTGKCKAPSRVKSSLPDRVVGKEREAAPPGQTASCEEPRWKAVDWCHYNPSLSARSRKDNSGFEVMFFLAAKFVSLLPKCVAFALVYTHIAT